MLKKIIKLIIILGFFCGVCYGFSLTFRGTDFVSKQKEIEEKIFGKFQTKTAEITEFYTYGKSLNVKGKISNISQDNFESIRLVISNGKAYQKMYKMNTEFKDEELYFSSEQEINNTIILDELENGEYYIFLRLKLNNSVDPKYYSFGHTSKYKEIEYYTVTKEDKNRIARVNFKSKVYNEKNYPYMSLILETEYLPEEVYDVVIDAGHGGTDDGAKLGDDTEADITLEYAKALKESLEKEGLKVKLTRTDENTESYTATNMYDTDGRITTACKSKAKLMISFHINSGDKDLNGFEIYCPSKSNLKLAKTMATKIKEYSTISYSNNQAFKKLDGVYEKNFTESVITEYEKTAHKKGYEPYPITLNTPYLYTIREVGGIATEAYVDGRNSTYSPNAYYNVNYGIECYQIELGYIKNDLEIIKNEKDAYIKAITEAIKTWK